MVNMVAEIYKIRIMVFLAMSTCKVDVWFSRITVLSLFFLLSFSTELYCVSHFHTFWNCTWLYCFWLKCNLNQLFVIGAPRMPSNLSMNYLLFGCERAAKYVSRRLCLIVKSSGITVARDFYNHPDEIALALELSLPWWIIVGTEQNT